MSKDSELVRGSGNVFRDFGRADAGAEQLKALLAAEIVGCLDRRRLTAQETGDGIEIAAADLASIRQARLDRFTVDRLMGILNRLGHQVDVAITLSERPAP